ncbi:hypothetical protein GCM10023264_27900 [Sphingomonas daechungensis]|uniref:Membrane lipoprotein lipid attachment site-containing protein n=1 Tax=Sphingomonas daechungensis TaxID=1176646 RepID=A0ABX6T1P2_9SPHN|nr:hypothetical protein [Sphingomonas daechungensis]QNP43334.1 hypothetical protein H9L15_00135 [Sphingomonas daechungensis]
MKRLLCTGLMVIALSSCGSYRQTTENSGVLDNVSVEAMPANDASALEAVEAQDSRLATQELANETVETATNDSNAVGNAAGNSQ